MEDLTPVAEAMERMRQSVIEVQLEIRDRFTPIVRATAHTLHSEWVFPMWPWWRRWWHVVRGCEWSRPS